MPNRIIKESVRTSDSLSTLSWFEEVLFYRLIVSCDDYGRFDARPAIIKGTCFPLKSVTENQIIDALNKLSTAGIVCLYTVDRKPYLQFVAWERHQSIRAKRSKYPSPDDADNDESEMQAVTKENESVHEQSSANICKQMHAHVPVIQSNPNPNPNTKNIMCKADACALFERIWQLYPEKKGKARVSEKKKLEIAMIGEEHMQRCISRYKDELDKDKDWRKPQNGSTFFNSGYVDYLDENYTPCKRDHTAQSAAKKNRFNNFEQREYDYSTLEAQLLGTTEK